MNGINSLTRPMVSSSVQIFLVTSAVLSNCVAKLVLKDGDLPKFFFLSNVYLAIQAILAGQSVLNMAERLHTESVHLIESWQRKGKVFERRGKRRRERKLRDRQPQRNRSFMPLAWEIGPFYKIDHRAGLDHLHTVIEHTFNAMILF